MTINRDNSALKMEYILVVILYFYKEVHDKVCAGRDQSSKLLNESIESYLDDNPINYTNFSNISGA